MLCIFYANTIHAKKIGGIPMLPILHHKMDLYGIYQASGHCTSWKETLSNVRQAKTAYGLNEKVIASVVSKSRKGYSYNLSPANRISFMLFTFHMLVQILFCTAFTKNTKQHGRHWCPLESGLNISSPWWILPCNNTDAFSCRFIWFGGPGFCSISIFSHLLTTSGFIQY